MNNRRFPVITVFLVFLISQSFSHVIGFWNTKELFKAPEYRVVSTDSVATILYEGITYKGKKTEVYALYCTPGMLANDKSKDKNLPAVVCVHGGGGSAYKEWVIRWAKKGYAAISIDWRGNGPDKKRLYNGGPDQTPFTVALQANEKINDSWPYQATSQIILAHSLIQSFPEVNSNKTIITGLSWGGFLTSLVCGIDYRFKAAIPVYGCGFIYEYSFWKDGYLKMPANLYSKWIKHFDPSESLKRTSVPFLFVTGTNDFFYPVTIWQKSANLVRNRQQLLKLRMPHATKATFETEEIYAFADSYVFNGSALPRFKSVKLEGLILKAKISANSKVNKAELLYTESDTEAWSKKEWKVIDLVVKSNFIEVNVPANYKACCVNITNDKGYVTSSNVFFSNSKTVTFRPAEIEISDSEIINSGRGWHLGYSWGPGKNSYDIGKRILWRDLEPSRDNYNFEIIDTLLNQVQKRGGRAIIRLRAVATSGIGVPDYMTELMPKGFWKDWLFNKKPETFAYVPDWNDPDFIERAKALLDAVGKKYNKDERLALIDIGMYGRWGEWHCAGIKYPTPEGAEAITEENIKAIIDMHISAFPNKRLVMMTDNIFGLKYALQKSDRIGWRRDSYGTSWFQDSLRMSIVGDRWKTAPVVAEPIGEFAPGSIKFCTKMEKQASEFHVATINGINTFKEGVEYTDGEIRAVTNAGKNSGFRFVVNSITLPKVLNAGSEFMVSTVWSNAGVTPAYEKWSVVYQLRNPKTENVVWEGVSSVDFEELLPTDNTLKNIHDTFILPVFIKSGLYSLCLVVKDLETTYRKPLALAIKDRQVDGSYRIGLIKVK